MAKEEYVRVELISNPAVKRTMTANSLRTNSNKWRLSSGQEEAQKEVTKKEAAEPAEVKSTEPAKPVATVDPEVEQLRADYLQKTGKPADKRWKADKLKAEIEK